MLAVLSCALLFTAPSASATLLINPVLHDGDDPALMNEIVNTVNIVAEQFPEVRGITVTTAKLPLMYAYARSGPPGSITVNRDYTSNPNLFSRMINEDVALHFHPALGHCSAAQLLAYHESAHIIDFGRGDAADELLLQRFGDGKQLHGILSGYSFNGESIHASEAIAEAFAAVKCDGGNWAEQELYHMLVG